MADRIVGEYSIKVDEAVKNLDKLAGRVGKLEDASKKAAKNTESEYSKMTSNLMGQFKNLAGAIGIAFSVQQVVALGREMVTLAAQAEGVERAFKRVGSPQLLADLRKATRGTVSDLQLMQNAVKASNFKIPLEQLASLFAFAKARASETGESVDYLVDSITTGIGRKSPLILDNLGISAVALKEKLGGVGLETASIGDIAAAVGAIATEEMAKMGNQADTTADRIAQITTALENMKIKGGEAINSVINDLIKLAEKKGLAESTLSFREQIQSTIEYASAVRNSTKSIQEDKLQEQRMLKEVDDTDALLTFNKEERIKKLQQLELEYLKVSSKETKDAQDLKLWFANQELESAVGLDVFKRQSAKASVNAAKEEIKQSTIREGSLKAQIELLKRILGLIEDGGGGGNEVPAYIRSMNQLNKELKDLNDEFGKAEIGGELWYSLIDRIEKKTRELKDATTLASAAINGSGFAELADADVITLIDDKNLPAVKQQLDVLGMSLEEAFGTDGTERIQMFWDDFLRSSLEALDKVGDETENTFDEINSYLDGTLQAWATVTNTVAQLTDAQYNRQLQALENQLRREQISREEYDRRRAALAREQFQKQKEFSIVQAVINTALGVTNAFATAPNIILGAVLAAVVAAAGAAEIATIASQPVPQFAEGGYVDKFGQFHGRKHAQGGITIEAEGGEFITSAKYAKPNADILKAINSGDWEKYKVENIIAPAIEQVLKGGFEGMGASYELNSMFNDKNLLRAFDRQRANEREVGRYIVDGIGKQLRSNLKDRYV